VRRGPRPALTHSPVLAVDVDGVLLDPQRGGLGPWGLALQERLGIDRGALREAFFAPHWDDIVVGRRPIEPALASALQSLGSRVTVDEVLECWFQADFVVNEPVLSALRGVAENGAKLVLATNQEHRRLAFLREHLEPLLPIAATFASAELGVVKADERFWTLATHAVGAGTLLDDDLGNVEVARRGGWGGVHFTGRDGWVDDVLQALGERGRLPA
jgi:putative hydrolase of the HAD superfamily